LTHGIEETCKREFISLDVKETKLQRATHHKFEFLRQQIMHGYGKTSKVTFFCDFMNIQVLKCHKGKTAASAHKVFFYYEIDFASSAHFLA